jgi:molecular chaperone GrpE
MPMADIPPKPNGPQATSEKGSASGHNGPGPQPSDDSHRERADLAERQRDEYFSLLRQAQADFENAHQRNRREREMEQKYRGERLALDLLTPIDNLERALAAAREAGETSPLVQGVSLAHAQMLEILKRHGVVPINALGQPFDPNVHQAVTQVASTQYPPNTVVQVLEQGYRLHDRVLRVAKVIISQPN